MIKDLLKNLLKIAPPKEPVPPVINNTLSLNIYSLYNIYIYKIIIGQTNPKNCIKPSCVKNLDLIGSNVNLSGLEVETASDPKRAFLLKEILNQNENLFKYINVIL